MCQKVLKGPLLQLKETFEDEFITTSENMNRPTLAPPSHLDPYLCILSLYTNVCLHI